MSDLCGLCFFNYLLCSFGIIYLGKCADDRNDYKSYDHCNSTCVDRRCKIKRERSGSLCCFGEEAEAEYAHMYNGYADSCNKACPYGSLCDLCAEQSIEERSEECACECAP